VVERRILITGAGGIGGVNFIRALRLAERLKDKEKMFLVGTDYNQDHLRFPEVDVRYKTPKHSDPEFINRIIKIVKMQSIEFLHPHPTVEAHRIGLEKDRLESMGIRLYLPRPEVIGPDKATINKKLIFKSVPAPETFEISSLEDVDAAFSRLGKPLWIRAKMGAGGRLSLKVNSPEEAKLWIRLNVLQGRANVNHFIIQEFLPGRDLAFDSLWYQGKLITSYARERIEYPFKHITLSGITGTPSIAKIVNDKKVNEVGINAVKALDDNPHGFYSVDLREDSSGNPKVTEVDAKWHTTAPLWGYAFSLVFSDIRYNLAYNYVKLGYDEELEDLPKLDLFPEGWKLVRQLDGGVIIVHDDFMRKIV